MFKKNRQQFFKLIKKQPAIIIGGMPIIRNGDVHYQFRQISNFYYLTGFDFPNAIAVFIPGKNKKYILFAEINDEKKTLWEGQSYNLKELLQKYEADVVYDIKDFAEKIVHIRRVAKTTKGGKNFHFTALVVIGNSKDKVGAGLGKSNEVPDAIRKGIDKAKKNLKKKFIADLRS